MTTQTMNIDLSKLPKDVAREIVTAIATEPETKPEPKKADGPLTRIEGNSEWPWSCGNPEKECMHASRERARGCRRERKAQ